MIWLFVAITAAIFLVDVRRDLRRTALLDKVREFLFMVDVDNGEADALVDKINAEIGRHQP